MINPLGVTLVITGLLILSRVLGENRRTNNEEDPGSRRPKELTSQDSKCCQCKQKRWSQEGEQARYLSKAFTGVAFQVTPVLRVDIFLEKQEDDYHDSNDESAEEES